MSADCNIRLCCYGHGGYVDNRVESGNSMKIEIGIQSFYSMTLLDNVGTMEVQLVSLRSL